MPTYTFYNNQTGEQFDALMKISEREEYLNSNPHIQQIVSAPALVTGVSTTNKVPDGFKEVLSKVSEAHPASPVAQKHGKRSIKQIKTENIIKKHLGGK
jgi:hypothetical protein